MKATDLIKTFTALKDKPLKVWIGKSSHLVTFKSFEDFRTPGEPKHNNAVRITCADETIIWAGSIKKIEFI